MIKSRNRHCSWPIIFCSTIYHDASTFTCMFSTTQNPFPFSRFSYKPFPPIHFLDRKLRRKHNSPLQLCEELAYGSGLNSLCGSRTKLKPTEGNFRKLDFRFNTTKNFSTIMNCFKTEAAI